jgi:hypothetical protein
MTLTAEYTFYGNGFDDGPFDDVIVEGYKDLETLKADTVPVLEKALAAFRAKPGEIDVSMIVTDEDGYFVTSDEMGLELGEDGKIREIG